MGWSGVLLPRQRSKLARRAKAKEPAMYENGGQTFRNAITDGRKVSLRINNCSANS
jgi:hypothetical protein